MTDHKPRLIVFAYSCAPGQGSEPGAGWGVVNALAEVAQVNVLVGARHGPAISEWQRTAPADAPTFTVVAEPRLEPYMKWHRIPRFLVYLQWLRAARKAAERLIDSGTYDGTAHVTFSAYWLPTPATDLGLPSIWGPVGGAVSTPPALWKCLGPIGLLQEGLDNTAVRLMEALPGSRRTARQATVRILQNNETLARLPAEARSNSRVLNHALFTECPPMADEEDGRYVLWVSPMESRKGPRLAIEAVAKTTGETRLVMVGDGPQRRSLQRLAERLGVAGRITFTGWITRPEAVAYMRGATTILFTGLREEGGLALAEALNSARRLIVLDHGGAGAIARRAIDPARVALIPPGSPDDVSTAIAAAIETHMAAPPPEVVPLLDKTAAVAELADSIRTAVKSKG